jgi:hypothetical protein
VLLLLGFADQVDGRVSSRGVLEVFLVKFFPNWADLGVVTFFGVVRSMVMTTLRHNKACQIMTVVLTPKRKKVRTATPAVPAGLV